MSPDVAELLTRVAARLEAAAAHRHIDCYDGVDYHDVDHEHTGCPLAVLDLDVLAQVRDLLPAPVAEPEPTCPNCGHYGDEHSEMGCGATADDAECACAMTEASAANCPAHGFNDVRHVCPCIFPARVLADLRRLIAVEAEAAPASEVRWDVKGLPFTEVLDGGAR
jgi:hypothetical protein